MELENTTTENVNEKMKNSVTEMRIYRGVTGDRVYAIIVTVHEPNYPNDITDWFGSGDLSNFLKKCGKLQFFQNSICCNYHKP